MNVHISYKVHKTPDIEKEINHHLEKLNRRLRVFRPELVHLHGLIEEGSLREGILVSLNLRLPSGQMAARENAPEASTALKAAFDDLVQQIRRHKDLLRRSHRWHRRGVTNSVGSFTGRAQMPLEQPRANDGSSSASSDNIHSYLNTHLGRLQRFVERELHFREAAGQMAPGAVTKEEVVDEAAVRALAEGAEETQSLAVEAWFYRLALHSMNDLISRSSQGASDLRLDESSSPTDGSARADDELGFNPADEFVRGSEQIPDRTSANPEQIAYLDELISLVQFALGDASRGEREVFILHALEGFSIDEIAAITDRPAEQVRASVAAARDRLRRSMPVSNGFKEKHFQQTSTR